MNKITLEQEANNFIKNCNILLKDEIRLYPFYAIREEILKDKNQKEIYELRDVNKILKRYKEELDKVKRILNDSDEETHILNILEYMRYMVLKEEYIRISGIVYFEGLEDHVFTPLLLGKGTSLSQARLFQELLEDPSYELTQISKTDVLSPYEEQERFYVLLKDGTYIDPYNYNNSIKSANSEYYHYIDRVKEKTFDEEKRKQARNKIRNYLINELNIPQISKKMIDDNDSLMDVIRKLINYLKSLYIHSELVNYHIVVINNKRIEISRLLELMLTYNKIAYSVDENEANGNRIIKIETQGVEIIIDINKILTNSTKNQRVYTKK